MCDMSSHFPSASAGGYAAPGHEQYATNGYDRHHHHQPPPQPLPPSSGPAHHQPQYPPLQYGHYPRYVPTSFDRLPNDGTRPHDGTNPHPEPSPNHNFAWSAPPAPQPQPPAQVFSQPYDSCSSRGVLTPPHDPHDAYATCKLQSGLESGASPPPPPHHNSHHVYSAPGVPSPGPQPSSGNNNLSPLYPWMRSQFGQYLPVASPPCCMLSCTSALLPILSIPSACSPLCTLSH